MKQLLIVAGAAYLVFQLLLVMAIMAVAAKPTPKFEPIKNVRPKPAPKRFKEEVRELELVS